MLLSEYFSKFRNNLVMFHLGHFEWAINYLDTIILCRFRKGFGKVFGALLKSRCHAFNSKVDTRHDNLVRNSILDPRQHTW